MEKTNDEEQFIFRRMAEGDKIAFRFFFEKYYTDLCNLVNIYLQDPVVSEEIVQDTYVYFWEKKESISIEKSVKSYLLKASKNKSLNYLRNEKNHQGIHEKLAVGAESSYEIQENTVDVKQLRDIIGSAVEKLPPECRKVFKLAKNEQLSYVEIAEQLNISAKTVENQMGTAFRKLREYLKPYYNEIFMFFLIYISFSI
ncbi:RNA polymerase sigma-70 factor, ECF subfamily [Mariniphaga anaerophila]|uniref:RNA polymerase sigma-70 factor, ECF subfamily n=1 Tax=Mariniphaga anaerophila TaxID=1484053 RepID=A0A1M5DGU3_9BACT|nr:RNA polymerase sigma-70 factor [Mariniphaga anaerophila]SHF66187.1 RNA polymerase sigma-70 factor, ECF subfamily [Mariniphaga anaerophila]